MTRGHRLAAFVVAFALWPAVQHVLVDHAGASPWALAGWGVYCHPRLEVAVGVTGELRPGETVVLDPNTLTLDQRRDLVDYQAARRALGRWLPPDRLARELLRDDSLYALHIGVRHVRLDPKTDRLISETTWYDYDGRGKPLGQRFERVPPEVR